LFQLTRDEYKSLRSQIVTLEKSGRGKYAKYQPYAFTEHGVVMLSSVLKSQRAIQVSLMVVEVFVKLRQMLSANTELAHKIEQLERKIEKHDEEITAIFEAIRQILRPLEKQKQKQIGFRP
jgi:CRISPR/Cas system-associated endonuclease Cas3-HD